MIGRARRPPLVGVVVGGARVQRTEVRLPEQRPVEVVEEQVAGGDQHRDVFPVGRRRGRGVAVLGMPLDLRSLGDRFAHPQHVAALTVDRVHEPGVPFPVGAAVHPPVRSVAEDRVRIVADRGGQEDPVVPDHRARVPEPRNRGLPEDVVPRLRVPERRRVLPVSDPGSERAPERRPLEPVLAALGARRQRHETHRGDPQEDPQTLHRTAHRIRWRAHRSRRLSRRPGRARAWNAGFSRHPLRASAAERRHGRNTRAPRRGTITSKTCCAIASITCIVSVLLPRAHRLPGRPRHDVPR